MNFVFYRICLGAIYFLAEFSSQIKPFVGVSEASTVGFLIFDGVYIFNDILYQNVEKITSVKNLLSKLGI